MNIIKLKFINAVHFGNGDLSESKCSAASDTLFSALCNEVVKQGGNLDEFIHLPLKISDLLPFCGGEYYLPKPVMPVKSQEADIQLRKGYKKLQYIPLSKFYHYVHGETALEELRLDLGQYSSRTRYDSRGYLKDGPYAPGTPYTVGDFTFQENSGLYVIVETSDFERIFKLFESLGFTGIGGKRTSGFGRFEAEACEGNALNPLFEIKTKKKMTLSSAMTKDLTEDMLQNATYILNKRSGFVYSETYADTNLKKKDFYAFAAGSVFETTFDGDIFDVSNHGSHKVYRYAKPMWVGVV
jgi:CRISPR-associated protein Csm4